LYVDKIRDNYFRINLVNSSTAIVMAVKNS